MKRRLFLYLILCLLLLAPYASRLTGEAEAANKFWWASCRMGGSDCLDGIDGNNLTAGDGALVALDSGSTTPEVYFYRCYASSASESDPLVIAPDSNPGTLRWHLVNIYGSSINAVAADTYRRIDVLSNSARTPVAAHNEIYPIANKWHLAENGADVGEVVVSGRATSGVPLTTIELGHASDTTLARVSAGVISVEGVTVPRIIGAAAKALDFGSTLTGACATVIQDTCTNCVGTDVVIFNPNASIKAVTGYVPAATGGFTITAFATSGYVNFEGCNWTSGTVDPGSITVNWMVIR